MYQQIIRKTAGSSIFQGDVNKYMAAEPIHTAHGIMLEEGDQNDEKILS